MIAFWADLAKVREFKAASRDSPAAVRFPANDDNVPGWAQDFFQLSPLFDHDDDYVTTRPIPVSLAPPPDRVWLPLDGAKDADEVPLPSYDRCFQGF